MAGCHLLSKIPVDAHDLTGTHVLLALIPDFRNPVHVGFMGWDDLVAALDGHFRG